MGKAWSGKGVFLGLQKRTPETTARILRHLFCIPSAGTSHPCSDDDHPPTLRDHSSCQTRTTASNMLPVRFCKAQLESLENACIQHVGKNHKATDQASLIQVVLSPLPYDEHCPQSTIIYTHLYIPYIYIYIFKVCVEIYGTYMYIDICIYIYIYTHISMYRDYSL